MTAVDAGRTVTLSLAGHDVGVIVRRSARARQIAIRIDPAKGGAELVLPPRVSETEGLDFVHSRADWLLDRLAAMPPHVPFRDGETVPFRGAPHLIVHDPNARGGVWTEPGQIFVSGHAEHLSRRLHDWMRREARIAITPLARIKADVLDRRPGKITIRDQKSRWGSCSSSGNLSFNWRLILAPETVLDYVVAHEVGHMAVPNHSRSFWKTVDRLTLHADHGRAWLRGNGDQLFRCG
jgi:predicted metal-dependent hydrolase